MRSVGCECPIWRSNPCRNGVSVQDLGGRINPARSLSTSIAGSCCSKQGLAGPRSDTHSTRMAVTGEQCTSQTSPRISSPWWDAAPSWCRSCASPTEWWCSSVSEGRRPPSPISVPMDGVPGLACVATAGWSDVNRRTTSARAARSRRDPRSNVPNPFLIACFVAVLGKICQATEGPPRARLRSM